MSHSALLKASSGFEKEWNASIYGLGVERKGKSTVQEAPDVERRPSNF